jgi:L-amino acid N-acyltransferase YncA
MRAPFPKTPTMPLIRPSTDADLDAITTIYAHHVLHGTGTFETTPPSGADMATRSADVLNKGLGRALLAELMTALERAGVRRVMAVIGDSANAGSIGVHRALGFEPVGTINACGWRFGRWLNIVFMQRSLGAGDSSAPEAAA